jgi:hypothetical protein
MTRGITTPVERELKHAARKGVREWVEGWIRARHWVWLALIVAVAAGYVEVPNLPVFLDDWVVSFAGFVALMELANRVWARFPRLARWTKSIPAAFKGRLRGRRREVVDDEAIVSPSV